jgi:beta-lactamase class D
MKQKQKQDLIQTLVAFVLWILHDLARALQRAQIKKSRRVEKVTVVDLE